MDRPYRDREGTWTGPTGRELTLMMSEDCEYDSGPFSRAPLLEVLASL